MQEADFEDNLEDDGVGEVKREKRSRKFVIKDDEDDSD